MIRRSSIAVLGMGVMASLALLAGCSRFGQVFGDDATRGQELFLLHCADCHETAHPELHKQPPKLEGLFQSKALPSGAPATDTQVRKTIVEGRGTMPAFDRRLSEKDVDELVRYLHTLK
jgi:mono/diheme cytochrome c family protein